MICELCKAEFKSLGGLHGHISKTHKQTQKDYYYFFSPRYDKQTGKLIKYSSYKEYFNTDFNTKDSFFDWLKENNEEGREYCLSLLKRRSEEKKTNLIPSQVELKSLFLPSLVGFDKIFGGLDKFFEAAANTGLKKKLDFIAPTVDEEEVLSIKIDTREQTPLVFDGIKTETGKLTAGDYAPNSNYFCDLFIERKSLYDLAGTLGNQRERFEREVIRAKSLGFYLVVLVECKYSEVAAFGYGNPFAKKMNGSHIHHEIRDLMTRYDNIQFLFSGNRARSTELVEKIFRMGAAAKSVDLEYLKDTGEI